MKKAKKEKWSKTKNGLLLNDGIDAYYIDPKSYFKVMIKLNN